MTTQKPELMPDEIWAYKDSETESGWYAFAPREPVTSYTRTDLYTAACAERDALRALCEGMVGKLKKLNMYTSDIESVHPAYDGEYGEWVRTDDVHEVITAYEKHKAGEK